MSTAPHEHDGPHDQDGPHDHDGPNLHGHGHGHGEHAHRGGVVGFVQSIFAPHSHDAADSVDSALEGSGEGIRAVKISLTGLGVTALLQLLVVFYTGSVALLADTIHNFSDALTAIPLWAAFVLGRRAATRRFTYGYGRAEDLAGVFIIFMIALSSVLAGYESIRRLIDPRPLTHVGVVIAAGIIGFAGNELVAVYRIRVGRTIGSAALVADGLHARTDGFTSLAVVIGALGVLAGFPVADPIIGILITIAILFVLRGAVTGVRGIESLRLRWVGHRMRAEVALLVDPALTVVDGHEIAVTAHHQLLHDVPRLVDATVHVSPAGHHGDQQHQVLAHHQR